MLRRVCKLPLRPPTAGNEATLTRPSTNNAKTLNGRIPTLSKLAAREFCGESVFIASENQKPSRPVKQLHHPNAPARPKAILKTICASARNNKTANNARIHQTSSSLKDENALAEITKGKGKVVLDSNDDKRDPHPPQTPKRKRDTLTPKWDPEKENLDPITGLYRRHFKKQRVQYRLQYGTEGESDIPVQEVLKRDQSIAYLRLRNRGIIRDLDTSINNHATESLAVTSPKKGVKTVEIATTKAEADKKAEVVKTGELKTEKVQSEGTVSQSLVEKDTKGTKLKDTEPVRSLVEEVKVIAKTKESASETAESTFTSTTTKCQTFKLDNVKPIIDKVEETKPLTIASKVGERTMKSGAKKPVTNNKTGLVKKPKRRFASMR